MWMIFWRLKRAALSLPDQRATIKWLAILLASVDSDRWDADVAITIIIMVAAAAEDLGITAVEILVAIVQAAAVVEAAIVAEWRRRIRCTESECFVYCLVFKLHVLQVYTFT